MPLPAIAVQAGKFLAKQAVNKAVNKAANRGGGGSRAGMYGAIAVAVFMAFILFVSLIAAVISMLAGGAGGGGAAGAASKCDVQFNGGRSVGQTPRPESLPGMHPVVLDAYVKAGAQVGIDWVWIAAIAKIESGHATANGANVPSSTGVISPYIRGIPLDGRPGIMAIRDTDGGVLDGDTVWDRAMGPTQFIPTTWNAYKLDGNGDGVTDPDNIYDAAATTGSLLLANGAPADMRAAIFGYNRSEAYVRNVEEAASEIRRQVAESPSVVTTAPSAPGAPAPGAPPAGAPAAPSTNGYQWPLAGKGIITSPFGPRPGEFHKGLDMDLADGAPIMAVADGVVERAENARTDTSGFGEHVRIRNNDGIVVVYGHMIRDSIPANVTVGAPVPRGTILGALGNTGASRGSHLHLGFFTSYPDAAIDPKPILDGGAVPDVPEGWVGGPGLGGNLTLDFCGLIRNYGPGTVPGTDIVVPGAPTPGSDAPPGAPAPLDFHSGLAWGGYSNGRVSDGELCVVEAKIYYGANGSRLNTPINLNPRNEKLRCDAATALESAGITLSRSNVEYIDPLGNVFMSGYRSYDRQQQIHAISEGGEWAPGTSPFGWGLAVQLVLPPSSEESMNRNGWFQPDWAKPGGARPTANYWEYRGTVPGDDH